MSLELFSPDAGFFNKKFTKFNFRLRLRPDPADGSHGDPRLPSWVLGKEKGKEKGRREERGEGEERGKVEGV